MSALLEKINNKYVGGTPHMHAIGMRVVAVDRGRATMVLPAHDRWLGDPERGWMHPGALTVLADSAAGLAVLGAMSKRTTIATLDLRMDYLRGAVPSKDIYCEAECYRLSRNVAFVRANLWQDDPAAPIADAKGTFMVIQGPERDAAAAGGASVRGAAAVAAWTPPDATEPLPDAQNVPYVQFLGITRSSTSAGTLYRLPFDQKIVGNPFLPAIHGGVIAGFAETAASLHLLDSAPRPRFPKGIDFSIDYLRSGKPVETFAACETVRVGSRVALVQVRCWQRSPDYPIAVARAHLLLGERTPLEHGGDQG